MERDGTGRHDLPAPARLRRTRRFGRTESSGLGVVRRNDPGALWREDPERHHRSTGRAERRPADVAPLVAPPLLRPLEEQRGRLMRLRALAREDAVDLADALARDPAALALGALPEGHDEVAGIVEGLVATRADGDALCLACVRASDARAVGIVPLRASGERAARTLEVAGAFFAGGTGRRTLGYEAALLLFELVFDEWNAARLDFRLDSTNQRARRVLGALGASFSASVRAWQPRRDDASALEDSVLYSLDAPRWSEVRDTLAGLAH